MGIKEAIIVEARAALDEQREDGSMPSGHNGPYFHVETPLRNTGHWLVTWSRVWQWTQDPVFLCAAERAMGYILLPEHRPFGENWFHRDQVGRDRCNGLIGAAWTIEALCVAHQVLGSTKALKDAVSVARSHRFNEKVGLWNRLEVDGEILSMDQTFNHQLWFAASIARLVGAGAIEFQHPLDVFMDHLNQWFAVDRDGLIRHRIVIYARDRLFVPGTLPHWLFMRLKAIKSRRKPVDARMRDIGYHAFNLHAFALLKQFLPDHSFWQSGDFIRSLEFSGGRTFEKETEAGNPYAYPYNPVGFEMALASWVFSPVDKVAGPERWMDKQWNLLTSGGRDRYGNVAADPVTARARIYEACEFLNS